MQSVLFYMALALVLMVIGILWYGVTHRND